MAQGKTWVLEGTALIFKSYFERTAAEDLEIFIFSNNYTPTLTCTNANLTEVTTNGLTKQDLATASWTVSVVDNDVVITFNSGTGVHWSIITSDINIYGYAIRGKTSNKIYYIKNTGLKELIVGNDFTINPFKLKATLVLE